MFLSLFVFIFFPLLLFLLPFLLSAFSVYFFFSLFSLLFHFCLFLQFIFLYLSSLPWRFINSLSFPASSHSPFRPLSLLIPLLIFFLFHFHFSVVFSSNSPFAYFSLLMSHFSSQTISRRFLFVSLFGLLSFLFRFVLSPSLFCLFIRIFIVRFWFRRLTISLSSLYSISYRPLTISLSSIYCFLIFFCIISLSFRPLASFISLSSSPLPFAFLHRVLVIPFFTRFLHILPFFLSKSPLCLH